MLEPQGYQQNINFRALDLTFAWRTRGNADANVKSTALRLGNARRYFTAAGARRRLHAGIRPHRRDGDAAPGIGRVQYSGSHQAPNRAGADAGDLAAASRRLSDRPAVAGAAF